MTRENVTVIFFSHQMNLNMADISLGVPLNRIGSTPTTGVTYKKYSKIGGFPVLILSVQIKNNLHI